MEQDLDHGRPPTPPHHPTAGVRVHRHEIEAIVACAFPSSELASVTQLDSGKSYNNRIYFLELRHSPSESAPQRAVLKVNGRFFGANKVQNEVACFQLLEKYCPDVPTPRALAWSEDGTKVTIDTRFKQGACSLSLPPGVDNLEHGGWILMSQVPGNPVAVDDLDQATLAQLGGQLGDIVASLRQNVPPQQYCGNVLLPHGDPGSHTVPRLDGSSLTIRDILQEGIKTDEPVTSANAYYKLRLEDKLRELETSATYAPNRTIAQPLRAFISETLPHLELAGDGIPAGEFVLTHYDLSPRNVLVSGTPPRITGLVDFEFAGFFSPVEEFLNDYIGNAGDWPQVFYDSYLGRLRERGVATPAHGFDPDVWNLNHWLETLAGRIAPWELPGGCTDEELREKLREAEVDVREMLKKLTGSKHLTQGTRDSEKSKKGILWRDADPNSREPTKVLVICKTCMSEES
ncbi:protein kinase-like protein [Purpureocillium lilacinum]|uniref:Protein kinase-like protein n=1 Tax=Purpureocillium lilacinum TaxID=33203 RepID=A0A179H696_PURLI|nr:protein kinase-like protein [Purpureocillium lilacinum]OAQ85278.1 protein kinase-like protein [Purpureocillium lilacinum]